MSTTGVKILVAVVVILLALPWVVQALKPAQPADTDVTQTSAADAPAEAVPAQMDPAPPAPSLVTSAQFDQVRPGMTYAQCVQLLGSEGQPAGRDRGGDQQYAWQLTGGSNPGEATLTFRNGIVSGKGFSSGSGRRANPASMTMSAMLPAQRPAAPPYICRAVNDVLNDGATYNQCVQLLGVEGSYRGRKTANAGSRTPDGRMIPATVDVYTWHSPTSGVTLTLAFRDGKLTSREMSSGRR